MQTSSISSSSLPHYYNAGQAKGLDYFCTFKITQYKNTHQQANKPTIKYLSSIPGYISCCIRIDGAIVPKKLSTAHLELPQPCGKHILFCL